MKRVDVSLLHFFLIGHLENRVVLFRTIKQGIDKTLLLKHYFQFGETNRLLYHIGNPDISLHKRVSIHKNCIVNDDDRSGIKAGE